MRKLKPMSQCSADRVDDCTPAMFGQFGVEDGVDSRKFV